jgi:hypothetical protein
MKLMSIKDIFSKLCKSYYIDTELQPFQYQGLTRVKIKDRYCQVSYCWQYTCKCGTVLTEGPSGGCSVNAVCKSCKINYGGLDGYYGD